MAFKLSSIRHLQKAWGLALPYSNNPRMWQLCRVVGDSREEAEVQVQGSAP